MAGFVDRLTIMQLPPGYTPGGFDCGEADITEYLVAGDALRDETASVTRTYLVFDGEVLVAYFSILSDAIQLNKKERPTPYGSAPALKLGRMGVHLPYQGGGREVGGWILDYVVGLARSLGTQIGIRYVTLDALPRPRLVAWYEEHGFVRNDHEDKLRRIIRQALRGVKIEIELPNISMRFDILLRAEVPPEETASQAAGGIDAAPPPKPPGS